MICVRLTQGQKASSAEQSLARATTTTGELGGRRHASFTVRHAMQQQHILMRKNSAHGHEGRDASGGDRAFQLNSRDQASSNSHRGRSIDSIFRRWGTFNDKRRESRVQYRQWINKEGGGNFTLARTPHPPQRVEHSPSQVQRTTSSTRGAHDNQVAGSRKSGWKHYVQNHGSLCPHKRTPYGGRNKKLHIVTWSVEGLMETGKYDQILNLVRIQN